MLHLLEDNASCILEEPILSALNHKLLNFVSYSVIILIYYVCFPHRYSFVFVEIPQFAFKLPFLSDVTIPQKPRGNLYTVLGVILITFVSHSRKEGLNSSCHRLKQPLRQPYFLLVFVPRALLAA